jgi:hypothetical protein
LYLARLCDALCNGACSFGGRRQCEVLRTHAGDFDVKVDAVEQRAGKPGLVIRTAFGRAAACLRGVG